MYGLQTIWFWIKIGIDPRILIRYLAVIGWLLAKFVVVGEHSDIYSIYVNHYFVCSVKVLYLQQVLWDYTRDKMYIDHYSNRIIRNNLVSFDIFQGDRFWFRRDFKRYCFLRVQIYINILLILSYPISVNFFPQLLGSFDNHFLSTV